MYITDNNKKSFKSIILLNEMLNDGHKFKIVANADDAVLEPLFVDLMSHGYVQTSGQYYEATKKGCDAFDVFMKRYTEFLKMYDMFSAVDLEKGEFAFASYFKYDSDEAWDKFANQDRFDDVRIAVALFKKVDPAEIVFMSFVNENHFDTTSTGWQMDLMSDAIWKEIEEICETAIKPEDLGEDAMEDMISQGSELMMELLKEEEKRRKEAASSGNNGGGEYTEEIIEEETVEYYRPYYDPFYVSPIWLLPLFLW